MPNLLRFHSQINGKTRAFDASGANFIPMTILLVEDSRFIRLICEKALTKAGHIVLTAKDGDEGLKMAHDVVPDLILLDMMLPKRDGISVLRALKADMTTGKVPVIVLSGLGEQNEARLLQEGAAAYFRKSDAMLAKSSELLVQAVHKVMGGSQAAVSAN